MKDKKLEDAIGIVCSCCPYIAFLNQEDDGNPAFANGFDNDGCYDASIKYCERCMVRKMTDYYEALDEHDWSENMPEYQAIINY